VLLPRLLARPLSGYPLPVVTNRIAPAASSALGPDWADRRRLGSHPALIGAGTRSRRSRRTPGPGAADRLAQRAYPTPDAQADRIQGV